MAIGRNCKKMAKNVKGFYKNASKGVKRELKFPPYVYTHMHIYTHMDIVG